MPAGQEEACEAVNVGTIPNRGTRSGTGLDFGGGGAGRGRRKNAGAENGVSIAPKSCTAAGAGPDIVLSAL